MATAACLPGPAPPRLHVWAPLQPAPTGVWRSQLLPEPPLPPPLTQLTGRRAAPLRAEQRSTHAHSELEVHPRTQRARGPPTHSASGGAAPLPSEPSRGPPTHTADRAPRRSPPSRAEVHPRRMTGLLRHRAAPPERSSVPRSFSPSTRVSSTPFAPGICTVGLDPGQWAVQFS